MKKILMISTVFLVGCAVNSISPSGGGLEVDMDLDLPAMNMRHGWTYFGLPKNTKTYVRDEASIERGKNLFLQHCQKCHGADGKGGGELAEALKIKPANLQNISQDTDQSYILVQINEGKGSMPQWKDFLTKKQAWDLTNYIREMSTQKK